MNKYYFSYNLQKINKLIITENIIPLIQANNANIKNNEILLLSKNINNIENFKKILFTKFNALNTSYIFTTKQFYQNILRQNILNTKNTPIQNIAIINDVNKTILMKEIVERYSDKDPYIAKLRNINSFQKELLTLIKTIKQENQIKSSHNLIIDTVPLVFDKWKQDIIQKYPSLKDKYDAIQKILSAYVEQQKEHSLADEEDALHSIINANAKNSPLCDIKRIFLLSVDTLSNLEIQLINLLLKRGTDITISFYFDPNRQELFYKGKRLLEKLESINMQRGHIETQDAMSALCQTKENLFIKENYEIAETKPPFHIIKGQNIQGEITLVAKKIKNLIKNGSKEEEIAIICKNSKDYETDIAYMLKQYKIPLLKSYSKSLMNSNLIKTILSVIKLRLYGLRQDVLLDFISSNYKYISRKELGLHKGYNTNAIANDIVRYYKNKKKDIFEYFDEIKKLAIEEKNKKKEEKVELIIKYLTVLKKHVHTLPAPSIKMPIYEIISKIKLLITDKFALLWNTYNSKDLGVIKEDSHILKSFFDILNELGYIFIKQNNDKVSLDEFFRMLRYALLNKTFVKSPFNNHNGVSYIEPSYQDIQGLSFEYIFVVGMTDAHYPLLRRDSALLSSLEKKQINKITKGIFKTANEKLSDEDLVFFNIINASTKAVFFSYPLFDNAFKDTLPSFYLDDIFVKDETTEKTTEAKEEATTEENEIHSLNELYEHYGKIVFDKEADFDKSLIKEDVRKLIEDKAAMEQLRDSVLGFSEYEGNIGKQEVDLIKDKSNNTMSPTKLTTYAECPHRYFFSEILKLKERREEQNILDGKNKGTAIHEILYSFYKDYKASDGDIETVKPKKYMLCKKLQEDIEKIANKYFEEQVEKGYLGVLFLHSVETTNIIESIKDFIAKDLGENTNYHRHLLEYAFDEKTNPFTIAYKDKEIYLKGKIDRIDMSNDNKYIRVIDYKSSKPIVKKKLEKNIKEGLDFQSTLYSKVALSLQTDAKLENMYYYYVLSSHKSLTTRSLEPADKKDKEINIDSYIDKSILYTKKYLALIEEGNFQANPRECRSYCEFTSVCRINAEKAIEKENNTGFWQNITKSSEESNKEDKEDKEDKEAN